MRGTGEARAAGFLVGPTTSYPSFASDEVMSIYIPIDLTPPAFFLLSLFSHSIRILAIPATYQSIYQNLPFV